MISIITPVYKGEAHIGSTLESISKQKANFEHLVMDAASPDNTCAIVQSYTSRYNVRVISEKDEGHYDAVQKGFARTKGDILGWINAGDLYMPWTLSVVEKLFELHPEVEWITGVPAFFFDQTNLFRIDASVPVYSQYAIRKGWHNGGTFPPIQQESSFWRRSLWDRSRGAEIFRGQGKGKGYAADYLLWRRFAEHARLRTACTVLAAFTISPGQITDRFRDAYAQECGLKQYQKMPNPYTRSLFRLYSFWHTTIKSNAISGKTLASDFPVRVL